MKTGKSDTSGLDRNGRSDVTTNESKERNAAVTKDATARKSETSSRRRSMVLLSLALGTALSALVVLASTAPEAETTFPGTNARITFASERTMSVDNPTGD